MNLTNQQVRQRIQPVRDREHIAFLHTLPCVCTLREGSIVVVHHLLRVPTNERGGAMKSGDDWCLPLADPIHVDLHHCGRDEREFLWDHGIYGPALAALLYRLSGNEDACRRAIMECRQPDMVSRESVVQLAERLGNRVFLDRLALAQFISEVEKL